MKEVFAFLFFIQVVCFQHWNIYNKLGIYYLTKIHNAQASAQPICSTPANTSLAPISSGKTYKVVSTKSREIVPVVLVFKNPVDNGRLESRFGKRGRGMHTGVDISAPYGTPIHAAATGLVSFCGSYHGYGQFIIITHDNGMISRYGHCSKIMVKRGQRVNVGMQIGKIGATGNARGSHLHFEIMRGVFTDPGMRGGFVDSGKLLHYY